MAAARVKYYGLFWISRGTYLAVQFLVFLICVAMMVVGLSVMLRTGVYVPHVPDFKVEDDLVYQALLVLFWAGLLILIVEGLETIVMLRKFARAEAARKAQSGEAETVEPPPASPGSTAVQLPPNLPPNTNPQP
ncbi:MAG TPA: hypothetical protein VH592_06190 [Gemmataceae bacterium]|jgi:hypothetical protein